MKDSEKYKRTWIEQLLFPSIRINTKQLENYLLKKTILITGATYGIGEALAYYLSNFEVNLILVARTRSKLEMMKADFENKRASVYIFCYDLREEENGNLLLSDLKKLPISTDIFISNAGLSIRRSIWKSIDRFHDFQRTMKINYFAPVQLCLGLLPTLKKNKGQIISVSAINVVLPAAPFWSAYQASKTAFDQWLQSVSPELEAVGIKCSSVYLPLVKTRMIEPTKSYANMPALLPKQAAQIILRCILKQNSTYKPWWLSFIQFASSLGGSYTRKRMFRHLNNKNDG